MKPGLINKITLNTSFNEELHKFIVKAGAMVENANNEVICKAIIQYAKDNGFTELNIIDEETLNKVFNDAVKYRKIKTIEEELGCSLEVIGKMIIEGCFYDGESYRNIDIGYVFDENEEGRVISVSEWENGHTMFLKDYKKTWWIEEDKSK